MNIRPALGKGRYTDVKLQNLGGLWVVNKTLKNKVWVHLKHSGVSKELYSELTNKYKNMLSDAGVVVCQSSLNGFTLKAHYVGKTAWQVIDSDRSTAGFIISQIVAFIRKVCESPEPLGLDCNLGSFCQNSHGQMELVDVFPPLIMWQGKKVVSFPEPRFKEVRQSLENRYYKFSGMLRALRLSLVELDPALEELLILELSEEERVLLPTLDIRYEQFLKNLNYKKALTFLEQVEDLEELRELVVRTFPRGHIVRPECMRLLFGAVSGAKFARCKKKIRSFLRQNI